MNTIETDRLALRKEFGQPVARSLEAIDPQVERGAFEHRSAFPCADERIEQVDQRRRRQTGFGARIGIGDWLGAIG